MYGPTAPLTLALTAYGPTAPLTLALTCANLLIMLADAESVHSSRTHFSMPTLTLTTKHLTPALTLPSFLTVMEGSIESTDCTLNRDIAFTFGGAHP